MIRTRESSKGTEEVKGIDVGNEEPEEGLDGNGKDEVDQEVEVEGGVEMNVEEAVNIPGGEDKVLAPRAARARRNFQVQRERSSRAHPLPGTIMV